MSEEVNVDFIVPEDSLALQAIRCADPELKNGRWKDVEGMQRWEGVAFDNEGHVTMLNLDWGTDMTSLPAEIGNLVRLKVLKLDGCREMTSLPAKIEKLVNLTVLHLGNCEKLATLPAEIGKLENLTKLNLISCCEVRTLPAAIGSLVNLTVLDLTKCEKLTTLPAGIGNLKKLTKVFLQSCKGLRTLPPEFGNLVNLTELDLCGCERMTTCLAVIGKLTNLTKLCLPNFCVAELTTLPSEITKLVNLKELSFANCWELKTLPEGIGQLVNLTNLDLRNCRKLTTLPPEIEELVHLTKLDLSNCKELMMLPAEIGKLVNLTRLDLSWCKALPSLPAEISYLERLKCLKLESCLTLKYPEVSIRNDSRKALAFFSKLFKMKRTPHQIGDMLEANDDTDGVTWSAFRVFCTYSEFAGPLYNAIKQCPQLANEIDPASGSTFRKLSEAACKESREAMQKAVLFLDRFDVNTRNPLHISATSIVLKADDYENKNEDGSPTSVALKLMYQRDQFLRELDGRSGLDTKYVIAIKQAFYDEQDKEKGELHYDGSMAISGLSQELMTLLSLFDKDRLAAAAGVESFKYLLVMDRGDCSLQDALIHDHLNENLFLARHITEGLAMALQNMHTVKRIHADVKPLNILRVDTSWKLIDFDVSCRIGDSFGTKIPSTGYCPPEMAKVICRAGEDMEKLLEYKAHIAYDLWSLGVVICYLLSGNSLWQMDRSDSITYSSDLEQLASEWFEERMVSKISLILPTKKRTSDQTTGIDLVLKLLEPNVKDRMKYFKDGMTSVLDHPFLRGEQLDAATLQVIDSRLERIESQMIKQSKVLANLGPELKADMYYSRKVLLMGMFEATEVKTPTSFVILREELPTEEPDKEAKSRIWNILNGDGTGFDGDAILSEEAKKCKERVEEGMKWAERLKEIVTGALEGDSTKIFESLKKSLEDLVVAEVMYFYLVDELTGKPVHGDGYPIKITTPSELVHKLLPLMQVTMRAASLVNGVSGIARMFGYPLPMVPKTLLSDGKEAVEIMKQESSVEKFGSVHENVRHLTSSSADPEVRDTVRGASLRELLRFFEEHDKDRKFADLCRMPDKEGLAIWTVLQDESAVSEALEKRYVERCAEKARNVAGLHSREGQAEKSRNSPPTPEASPSHHTQQAIPIEENPPHEARREDVRRCCNQCVVL